MGRSLSSSSHENNNNGQHGEKSSLLRSSSGRDQNGKRDAQQKNEKESGESTFQYLSSILVSALALTGAVVGVVSVWQRCQGGNCIPEGFLLPGDHSWDVTTFQDILDTREALLPEQKRMPTHLFTWTEKYGFKSWTIKETGTPENVDDRSSGVVQFLNAIMPKEFPERFKAGQAPFHVPWVTSDFPQVECIDSEKGCPSLPTRIFSFGTVPKNNKRMIGLSQAPTLPFTPCLAHAYDPVKTQCDWFSTKNPDPKQPMCASARLDFKNYNSENAERKAFDKLLNKAVWRGSDWHYLEAYPKVGTLDANRYVRIAGLCDKDIDTIQKNILDNRGRSDTDVRHRVPPRLRAAIIANKYPDNYDIKFSDSNPRAPAENCIDDRIPLFSSGDVWNACQFEKYKYLVDIGGGGGTSWKSTFRFLAMPGVLFHHETMMRDSFYDDITPWVHYIPLNEDMSDLHEKFLWAESHPEEAFKISKQATQFVKDFITPDGLKEHARKHFVPEMKDYIEGYTVAKEDYNLTTADMVNKYSGGTLQVTLYEGIGPAYSAGP